MLNTNIFEKVRGIAVILPAEFWFHDSYFCKQPTLIYFSIYDDILIPNNDSKKNILLFTFQKSIVCSKISIQVFPRGSSQKKQ